LVATHRDKVENVCSTWWFKYAAPYLHVVFIQVTHMSTWTKASL
jgi:hypothetical protein